MLSSLNMRLFPKSGSSRICYEACCSPGKSCGSFRPNSELRTLHISSPIINCASVTEFICTKAKPMRSSSCNLPNMRPHVPPSDLLKRLNWTLPRETCQHYHSPWRTSAAYFRNKMLSRLSLRLASHILFSVRKRGWRLIFRTQKLL